MIRFLVLISYFGMTFYLHLTGKLNQYINMQYSYLAYISMGLCFIFAIIQLYIWMKQVKTQSSEQPIDQGDEYCSSGHSNCRRLNFPNC